MSSESNYPWFYFYRVARLTFLVFIPTLFLILFFYRSSYKEGLISQMTLQVEESLKTVRNTLTVTKMPNSEWCLHLDSDLARYSLIHKDGKFICDSEEAKKGKAAEDLDEVTGSLKDGFYSRVRFSNFYNTQSLFAGLKVSEELVLRKVVPITSLKDDLNRFDRVLFQRIVPVALFSYILFLLLFYYMTKPLANIINKVRQINVDIPFNRNLQLLYKQNDWLTIEETLNEADSKIRGQVDKIKNENEKITAILESIYDKIIAIDHYESVLFFNSKFQTTFMQKKSHELVLKIWHTITEKEVLEAFRTVLKNGQTVSLKGLQFKDSQKPENFFDLTITPLKSSQGQVTGALGVFYDVTDFKLTEQMRVDFVANVSHEIRTPLTSIKGYTQVLQSQTSKLPEELHGFLEKITANTERMISLFNDLLNLSVIESKYEMRPEVLNLVELLEEVVQNISTNYPNRDLSVSYDLKLSTIRGDRRLIEQVLSNLLDNACKYSQHAISVKFSSWEENQKAYISIRDNGPGISKEHLQRIFERFYRVDSSREVSRGTGLGLSIVKHIVAKHGGRIWAESEGSEGTTFFVELPV
jgi:two-component system, OmpR family, phosphate regulon sensor histidine kinase PhoR